MSRTTAGDAAESEPLRALGHRAKDTLFDAATYVLVFPVLASI